jgi:hypothetical protein
MSMITVVFLNGTQGTALCLLSAFSFDHFHAAFVDSIQHYIPQNERSWRKPRIGNTSGLSVSGNYRPHKKVLGENAPCPVGLQRRSFFENF